MEPYQLLEKELAGWSGMPYVVCCSSGTAALHLALESLQLPSGSRVIVPDLTMIACPRAVTLAGLEPVFVDCDKRLCMGDATWKKAVREETEAVMFVHVYGRRCTFPKEWDTYGATLRIVEDLAEAHGVKPHPQTDAACYSFYRNKIICGEEGGAVGFRDPKLAARARHLRSLGFTDDHDFVHVPRGCNYRLSNANAELVRKSLWHYRSREVACDHCRGEGYHPGHGDESSGGTCGVCGGRGVIRTEGNVNSRREAESWYDELCPDEWKMPPRDAPWVYDVRIPGMIPLRQTEVVRSLQAVGIAARHCFKPCSTQEEYRHCPVYGNGNAAVVSREVFYLPLDPGKVTRESARRAFEVIRRVVG